MNLACPACSCTNRVPGERLHEGPLCGKCGAALMPDAPFALDDRTLAPYLQHTDLPVIVDFWAPWCGPCRVMAPQFEAAARELPRVRFAKVDSDESPRSSGQMGIRGIPTLVLFHGGREVARHSGAVGAAELVAWIRSHLAGATAGGAA